MAIAVIGTGLAGLACAQELTNAGKDVILFDKSRGYGGRMATRRRDGFTFDHGLPAFDPVAVETIPALSALPEWGAFGRVAPPRMNAFARDIGETFKSRMGARITRIDFDTLAITDETGETHDGLSHIVIAIPAPQASALLGNYGEVFAALETAQYTPGWTLLLGGIGDTVEQMDRSEPPDGPLALVIRNDAKPGYPAQHPCYVAHARIDWAIANLERAPDDVAAELCQAFTALTGLDAQSAAYCGMHRWRFCRPSQVLDAPFLLSADGRIGACGDWAGSDRSGGDARAAWRSGEALARAMV